MSALILEGSTAGKAGVIPVIKSIEDIVADSTPLIGLISSVI